MRRNRLSPWLPFIGSLFIFIVLFISFPFFFKIPPLDFFNASQYKNPKNEIIYLIQHKYVDDVKLGKSDSSIDNILQQLDPHSVYISTNELKSINEQMDGSFFGIGIKFNVFKDTLYVVDVVKGGPSEKAGLETGDKIIKVDKQTIAGKNITEDSIRNLITGENGSKVSLEILRDNRFLSKSIERGLVNLNSIDASYMINSSTGYIKISSFTLQTYHEFMIALTDLKKKGLQKLILDLRDNGGGILDQAVEIADELLEGDKLITFTEGKHNPKKEYRCRRLGQFEKGKLMVLCNESSASASEVLMGALQDWDRATIIGSRSFGKGLVQEQFELSDHSAIRLTIARYFTPVGRCIQRSYKNGEKAYYDEIKNRIATDENDSMTPTKKDIFFSSKGKKLLGGGGIFPDYKIFEKDTTLFLLDSIWDLNTINDVAFHIYLEQEKDLKRFKNIKEYDANFKITEAITTELSNSLSIKKEIANTNTFNSLKEYIKQKIASYYFSENEFIELLNAHSSVYQKALELSK